MISKNILKLTKFKMLKRLHNNNVLSVMKISKKMTLSINYIVNIFFIKNVYKNGFNNNVLVLCVDVIITNFIRILLTNLHNINNKIL